MQDAFDLNLSCMQDAFDMFLSYKQDKIQSFIPIATGTSVIQSLSSVRHKQAEHCRAKSL